jgi:hypothetical protein
MTFPGASSARGRAVLFAQLAAGQGWSLQSGWRFGDFGPPTPQNCHPPIRPTSSSVTFTRGTPTGAVAGSGSRRWIRMPSAADMVGVRGGSEHGAFSRSDSQRARRRSESPRSAETAAGRPSWLTPHDVRP